jgi:hypothetical protein
MLSIQIFWANSPSLGRAAPKIVIKIQNSSLIQTVKRFHFRIYKPIFDMYVCTCTYLPGQCGQLIEDGVTA